MKFTLFRIICTKLYEQSLFPMELNPRYMILNILKQQPSGELREGYTWHVGNLNIESEDFVWFRFGRISDAILPQYDDEKKIFIDEESEQAPNSLVLIDMNYQVIAIENKYKLHPNVIRIGNTLELILNGWLTASKIYAKIEIREIRDLEDIINFINSSYRILEVKFEVGRKNNWDVDSHVQRPHEALLEIINGDLATTEIQGANLNKDATIRVTRAVNAKGRRVKVKAMRRPGEKATRKSSESSHKSIDVDSPRSEEDMLMLFDRIRLEYMNTRNGN
jgi:hypothetical protein